ncbi:DUF4212 domain-containing protein [Natrialbaceae archaeon AArc-T1-2]|uniref:DUF4212 domain-containing protein n=1 Tax=Natrialbaceae archaeon AArc-T1-2 TaxID=3053904 RepID=UPI00255ACBD1|nr:DUF4212 domain-containing protein [Natrialbaceae archaeon AArc-T1-2]WIV66616.1 DUF4212 domain-containing protein [Natrialbaceae archaeon AArc-T1-2]
MSDGDSIETDGGVRSDGTSRSVDYLDAKINLFNPATPFMRDHLTVIWGLFAVWVVFTFGPVTATAIATDFMTNTHVLGFQLHYLLTALGSPIGALVLCAIYAWQRDRLDARYGIDHETESESEVEASTAVATDGGEQP